MNKTKKHVFIKTYGCQMNVYDSDRMADILEGIGYKAVLTAEEADLIILNTCHIREKAAEKVYSELGRLRLLKTEREEPALLAVAGCVAQAEAEEIFKRIPEVRIVCGPQSYHLLPEMLKKAEESPSSRVIEVDFTENDKFDVIHRYGEEGGDVKSILKEGKRLHYGVKVSDFLTIQEGCDKFCTYCVVPYTRGAEFSRPVDDVLHEAEKMVRAGVKEITLLGQNVNAYHGKHGDEVVSLGGLIQRMQHIDGLERIRYTTSHPGDMDDDLIEAHAECSKLMPFLHLPVQSGSDKILKAMNRKHTADHYRRIIEKLRVACPEIAFSSDFIVGFPGETDEDFEQTLDLVRDVKFASAFSFKYSPRPGTPAALYDPVDEAVKDKRLQILQKMLKEDQNHFNEQSVGKEYDVLFEKRGQNEGQIVGRSPYLQPVHVEGEGVEAYLGQVKRCKIVRAEGFSLFGYILEGER